MNTNPLFRFSIQFYFFAWTSLFLLFGSGCTSPTNCANNITQPSAIYPANDSSYGASAYIPILQYDKVNLRAGDLTWLVFPCSTVTIDPTSFTGCTVTIYGNMAAIKLANNNGLQDVGLDFSVDGSSYHFTIVNKTGWVWPGDANADGRRNMLDIYPVALGMADPNTHLNISSYQNQDPHHNELVQRINSGQRFTWIDHPIDFVHADANGDGILSQNDIDITHQKLTPLFLPSFLDDAINGYQLEATALEDQFKPIISGTEVQLWAPFQIDIKPASLNNNQTDSLIGIIFSRNVTETDDYQVGGTEFLLNDQIFSNPDKDFWRQRYWVQLGLQYSSEPCLEAEDKVLDVGLMSGRSIREERIEASNCRVGICGVTLIDILKTSNIGRNIPIYLHLVNGAIFTLQNGFPQMGNIECSSDTTEFLVSENCEVDLSIRDNPNDKGWETATDSLLRFKSPDIWLRHSADGGTSHQVPTNDSIMEVYLRVYNLGCEQAQGVKVSIGGGTIEGGKWNNGQFSTTISLNIAPWSNTIVHFSVRDFEMKYWNNAALMAVVNHPSDPAPLTPQNKILSDNNVAVRALSLP